MFRNEGVPPVLWSLVMDAPAVHTLQVTHLHEFHRYISKKEEIFVII